MISSRPSIFFLLVPLALLWLILCAPFFARAQSLDLPVQGFVSIEPYEVRQTYVVRIDSLAIETGDGITSDQRQSILTQAEELLQGGSILTLDGQRVILEHERSEFIRNDPVLSIVTDEREVIPDGEAVVAIVFAASRPGFPEIANITWSLFPSDAAEIEITFRSPSDKKKFVVTPSRPTVMWKVPETAASLPQLEKLPALTPLPRLSIPLLSIVLGIAAITIALLARKLGERTPPAFGVLILGTAIGAFACWKIARLDIVHPFETPPTVTAKQADEITYALLINLYHAFDYRDEDHIYDTLEQSAYGPLLERIYLEISRSLTLEDQGGAKVRIKSVDLRRCVPTQFAEAEDPRTFRADCEWVAIGDVTHWAHTHTRLNRYTAEITIAPVSGEWRMTNLQNLDGISEVQQMEEEEEELQESATLKPERGDQK